VQTHHGSDDIRDKSGEDAVRAMKPSLEEIEHANDDIPHWKDNRWISVSEEQVKKYYFVPRTDYYGSHRVAALKDGTFAVENGGGQGWYKCKTWNEAVMIQKQLRSRWVMLTRAME
jgi:hypothetical protein